MRMQTVVFFTGSSPDGSSILFCFRSGLERTVLSNLKNLFRKRKQKRYRGQQETAPKKASYNAWGD